MKFKKSLIVILLFIALISIPISFASDIQSDIGLNQENNDLIIDNVDLNQESDLIISDNLEESLDDEILDEDINANGNILSSDDESSQYEVSSHSSAEITSSSSINPYSNSNSNYDDLPNLDTGFAEIDIICTDENTIFVNKSYTGSFSNGSQSNPFKSIVDAFDQLKNSSNTRNNIFLAEGTYSVSSVLSVSDKSFNLIGENTLSTVIDGLNKTQILSISNKKSLVNIINLTFANGLNYRGSAIYVSDSSVNIINSIFKNNHANDINSVNTGEGGAIYNNAGFINIFNSTFSNNSIYGKYSKYGGAIYNKLGNLSIFNSKFTYNNLQGNWTSGGAIYSYNGFLTIFNSSILNSTANPTYHSLGGAICIWNGRNTYIINSTISGNRIGKDYAFGSAIAHKGVLLKIINSTISNNYADGISVSNSTVYNINGNFYCENTRFENNGIKTVKSDLLLCLEDQLIISDAFDIDSSLVLPSSYDLRDEGLVTSVKSQLGGTYTDNCWAFAIYAALESYLLKYENITYDLSENNMKNEMYREGSYGVDWHNGGNHIMALAYLLRGSGPVDESLDPYDTSSIIPKGDFPILKYVTGFKYIPLRLNCFDNDQIKYAILQYGALYTSIYSGSLGSGYSDVAHINNHAVAIVGWDDNYPASNFYNLPPGDGAWIIKNSWGNSSGDKGYYYISYYDASFAGVTDQFAAIAITSVDNLTEYGKIYQYDPLGNSYESIGYNSNTAWFANQFKADSNGFLKAFGLYTFGSSSYLVNITVNGISKLVQSGNLEGAGYHTVKLNSLINLAKGDTFKIAVKLTTPDSLFPIAIESYRDDYSTKVSAQLGQSFISPDGRNWYDIAKDTTVCKFYQDLNRITLVETNVCLKAYTEYADDLSLNIKSNATIYTKGDLINFNIVITNYGSPSGEIKVSSVLDSSLSIVSYLATKGSFNKSSGIWTINNLGSGQKETLKLVLKFKENKSSVKISVSANSKALSANKNVYASIIIKYKKASTKIIASNLKTTAIVKSIDGKTGKYLKIKLKDQYGYLLGGKKVLFTVNKIKYYRTTNKKGIASLQINLAKAGTYKVKITFAGNKKLAKSSKTVKVYVKKQSLKLKTANKKFKLRNKKKILTATLRNSKGKYIKNKKITFKVNGKKYTAKTNKKGIAKVKVKLQKRKTYSFTVKFAGDNSYKAVSKKAKVIIK